MGAREEGERSFLSLETTVELPGWEESGSSLLTFTFTVLHREIKDVVPALRCLLCHSKQDGRWPFSLHGFMAQQKGLEAQVEGEHVAVLGTKDTMKKGGEEAGEALVL